MLVTYQGSGCATILSCLFKSTQDIKTFFDSDLQKSYFFTFDLLQVHAVVLLYNYYQRKLQPELEFLNLVSFCELVAVLKPALMPFMKLMHQSDYSQLEGQENQLSPTEKAIQDGCDLCRILEASKCTPVAQGRPINKVAVLVIDSSMENCLLLHSAATQGVWSVIEKELDVSNNGSWGTVEAKCKSQKRRTFKLPRRCNQTIDTSGLKTLALLAVKEVAGAFALT